MGCTNLIGAVLTLCMAAVAAPLLAEADLSCGEVIGQLEPCLPYLENEAGSTPPGACCAGVESVNAAAATAKDRQSACVCLKNAVKTFSGISLPLAATLPRKCGVSVPYKISPSTNCNRLQ